MERPNRAARLEMTRPPLPDVLDYVDFRAFLRDRLGALQQVDAKFSQRWIAKRAGFRSPQLLSMIVSGQRNLARARIEPLAQALKLDERESEYFSIIVELSQSSQVDEQKRLLERIRTTFQNGLFAAIPDEGLEILRHWYLPAVREIVTLAEFDHQNPHTCVAERLGISQAQAREAIELLLAKGFLRRDHETLVRAEPSIHTRDKIYPMVIGRYNLQVLEQAFKAHGYAREKRYFESLTFAMPRRLMPPLIEAIKRFFREIDTLVESHQEREEVCQLSLQFFPLTRWSAESAEKESQS